MKYQAILAAATLAAPATALVHAQERGFSAEEAEENGQQILIRRERQPLAPQQALEQVRRDGEALQVHELLARRFVELETWLRRLPGHFRIDGEIQVTVVPPVQEGAVLQTVDRTGRINGVANCEAVGEGVGLTCVINASWPTLDPEAIPKWNPTIATPTETINVMRPAVLVMGLNLEPPGIRSVLVTSDSYTSVWVGTLRGNTATSRLTTTCIDGVTCYRWFEVIAEPDSDRIALVFRSLTMTLTFTMIRDSGARMKEPLKPLKSR